MRGSARLWVLLGSVAFTALAVLAFQLWKPRRSPVAFPEDSDIVNVTASLSGEGFSNEPVPEFTVPPKYLPQLLAAFRPAWRENYPAFFDEPPMGELKFALRDGGKAVVKFGFSGKNPLCYNFAGVRCIRGGLRKPIAVHPVGEDNNFDVYIAECVAVVGVIREIHQELVTGEKSQSLVEGFASLERSAGLRPPEILKP